MNIKVVTYNISEAETQDLIGFTENLLQQILKMINLEHKEPKMHPKTLEI